jgi:hypothetical protein
MCFSSQGGVSRCCFVWIVNSTTLSAFQWQEKKSTSVDMLKIAVHIEHLPIFLERRHKKSEMQTQSAIQQKMELL